MRGVKVVEVDFMVNIIGFFEYFTLIKYRLFVNNVPDYWLIVLVLVLVVDLVL